MNILKAISALLVTTMLCFAAQKHMVANLVHRSADDQLAVIAVLIDSGGANATIDTIWKNLPK